MRVCMITSARFPPEEGLGNYVYTLSKELIRKGNSVTIITRGGFKKTTKEDFDGITLFRVPFIPLYPLHVHLHGIFMQRLFKKLEGNFDIIHYHSPLPPLMKSPLSVITTVHSPVKTSMDRDKYPITVRLQSKISYLIERKIFFASKKIIAVSSTVSKELGEYGIDPSDVEVVFNAVDERKFYPISKKVNEKYILFSGRLTVQKGIIDFVECALRICERNPDVNFKIVGKGPLIGKINEMIDKSNFSSRFEIIGHIGHGDKKRLIYLYQNATIFIIPSHYEGLPTTLLEAMACGLPVISTATSGALDVIEHEKNGLLIQVNSKDQMESAISRLLNDPSFSNELGFNARKTIENKFTWDKISDRIIHCYNSIL